MPESIYNFTLSLMELTGFHERELIEKRGFSKESIKHYRFVSSGPYMSEVEPKLRAKFTDAELITSGIFIDDGKSGSINPTLLEERIVIPYLDKAGECYLLRPHKMGLTSIPIEVYHRMNLWNDSIILTEGEFKAAAGCQLGFATIAVPGISSFSEKHFPELVKVLNDHKVRKVCVIFDNEVKDDPAFPLKYKDNPQDRYDTQFYAYYMAKRLSDEGFSTEVGWLPDGWRKDGKIDIDGAMAQGRTHDDLAKVVKDAKPHKQYLSELDKDIQQILLRKNAQKRYHHHIRKEFGHYVATRKRGKLDYDEVISNFIIKIVATHRTQEGVVREIMFINEFGESSGVFGMEAGDMVGSDSFSSFCYLHGNFCWRGTAEDLSTIWQSEFLMDDGRTIMEPDHIGWVESERMWMFGNVAITEDGKELRPDKNHVFWREKRGIKPVPLGITTGKMAISEGIPYLHMAAFDVATIRSRLGECIGANEAALCLGWISAVPFMEEVFDAYGCFPFLFVTGRRGSGKSTVAEWLMNFYGLENAGKMAADTTAVGVQRYLAYYASLPVFLDEYRNTKFIMMKNGFFRNAYNRQSAGKGIKDSGWNVREAKIRGTLLLSGEETPEDNALLTRCIPVLISEKNRTVNHFNWFQANRGKFSCHIYDILKRKKDLLAQFMKVLNEGKEFFVGEGADDRLAVNYAIVAAGYAIAFGESDIDFAKWLAIETTRVRAEYQDEQAVSVFLHDLLVLKTRKEIDDSYWDIQGGKIYIYGRGLYNIWSKDFLRSRGEVTFKESAIRDYLKEEPGYIESGVQHRWKGERRECTVFDLDKAPDEILSLVGRGEGWQEEDARQSASKYQSAT
jgi:DNA primase